MRSEPQQIGHLVTAAHWRERWTKLEPIGIGGQGQTFSAKRNSDGVRACIKALRNNDDVERRRRFVQEANALVAIQNLRVPTLIETNANRDEITPRKSASKLYMAIEYVNGITLTELINKNGPMIIKDSIEMLMIILNALVELHPTHVHRDIKPDNIILRNNDYFDPVLVDFGLSASSEDGTSQDTLIGQELGNRFLRLPELGAGSENEGVRLV
jgi:serine/threonine-protein kinase